MLYSRVGTGAAVRTVHLAAPAADEDQASAGAQSALTALLPSWKPAVPLPLSRSMHRARRRSLPAPAERSSFRARKRASPSSGVRHPRISRDVVPVPSERSFRRRCGATPATRVCSNSSRTCVCGSVADLLASTEARRPESMPRPNRTLSKVRRPIWPRRRTLRPHLLLRQRAGASSATARTTGCRPLRSRKVGGAEACSGAEARSE